MATVQYVDSSFNRRSFDGASLAFGVFDGVHRGHRYLLAEAISTAARDGGYSAALTFDVDPDELFAQDRLKKLMTNEDRIAALAESGIDVVYVLPFTRDFAAMTPFEFLEETFDGHSPLHIHVGEDFSFGKCASGKVGDLETWAADRGVHIHAHHLVSSDDLPVTATRVRGLLSEGNIEEANELLGRPYAIHDTVRPGRQDGRRLGFLTANLELPPERQVATPGVYAGYAIVNGRSYRAAIALGVSPFYQAHATATCEAHILDFSDDLYGQDIWLTLHHYIRPMIKFESEEELVSTVLSNIQWVREMMTL